MHSQVAPDICKWNHRIPELHFFMGTFLEYGTALFVVVVVVMQLDMAVIYALKLFVMFITFIPNTDQDTFHVV